MSRIDFISEAFVDFDQFHSCLSGWDADVTQLSPGPLRLSWDEVAFDEELMISKLKSNLAKNADGSIDIYIGPTKFDGDKAKNWTSTKSGRAWFPYFRLYSPKKAFLDQTWVLPDIQKAK